jgi:hypothetical protein
VLELNVGCIEGPGVAATTVEERDPPRLLGGRTYILLEVNAIMKKFVMAVLLRLDQSPLRLIDHSRSVRLPLQGNGLPTGIVGA